MTNLLLILLLLVGCSKYENPLDQQYDQCIEGYDICGNCNGISIDINSNGIINITDIILLLDIILNN